MNFKIRTSSHWSWLVLLAAVCFPRGVSAQTVSYNYAQGVNFVLLKTYKWVNIEGAGTSDPSLDRSIREAIEAQLASKGLQKSADGAQVLILYQASVMQEKEITMYSVDGFTWGYGPGWLRDQSFGFNNGYNFMGTPPMSTATDATIPVGNLVFDMYDFPNQQLVWRAEVSKALTFVGDADKRWQRLNKAVASLFGPYPPKPRSVIR